MSTDNSMFKVKHLTAKQIEQLEEALNTMDLEFLVAAVEKMIAAHVRKAGHKR